MYSKILTTAAAVLLFGCFGTASVYASGDASPPPPSADPSQNLADALAPEIGYYDLTPDFTTNLANNNGSRMHYLRLHVSVMVKDSQDLELLTTHDAIIRDAILSIIGAKEYNSIATAAGREALRAECRARVAELLAAKKNGPVVQDLLFTSYIYQ